MNYLTKSEGISALINFLDEESIIPIIGAGFSGGMPSLSGKVPMGKECTDLMKQLLLKYSELSEEDICEMDFTEASKWFNKKVSDKCIPEGEYIRFYRNNFTSVTLDDIRCEVLKMPWKNIYTINVDDGIENTGLYQPILPYKDVRLNTERKGRVFKLHGDAKHEVDYEDSDNIVFDQNEYRHAMESEQNRSIRNNIINVYREFNIIYIGCSLINEPDLEWYYSCAKNDKAITKIFYLTKNDIGKKREGILENFGVTDIIKVDDYESFYIDLAHEFANKPKKNIDFPYMNPEIKVVSDKTYEYIYGIHSFETEKNSFIRSDILIDRIAANEINNAFKKHNIVVLSGRRFSGRTSLLTQMCKNEKTQNVFFFPSTSSFDYDIIYKIIKRKAPSLILFDSNSLQSEVYLGLYELQNLICENNHKILIVEQLEDTYLTQTIDCEIINLKSRFEANELALLNRNLDKYGLLNRKPKDTNLDYLTRLKEEQKIDFPKQFNIPERLSNIEKRLLLVLAAQDKAFSRDIHMMGISEKELANIINRLGKLCEKVKTSKGESKAQSMYKVVHNSRSLVLYLLRKENEASNADVAKNIRELVEIFYQNKERMQKQIAISVMQFDTLNEIYGSYKGAGRLIEQVYEELQPILNKDSHYWLQRSKSIYRMNPTNIDKLKKAYQYCVKAGEGYEQNGTNFRMGNKANEKLYAQTALSLSLISGLLSRLLSDREEGISYAQTCIYKGRDAMESTYYESSNRKRLEKEKADRHQSYEELYIKVCSDYIERNDVYNDDCKNVAIKMYRMIGSPQKIK